MKGRSHSDASMYKNKGAYRKGGTGKKPHNPGNHKPMKGKKGSSKGY